MARTVGCVAVWGLLALGLAVAPARAADPVIVAGGDVACDPGNSSFNGGDGTTSPPPGVCHQRYTSDLFAGVAPAHVLALGDLQYEDGALAKFQTSYDLATSWGRAKSITKPVPGNHEYGAGNTNNGNIHHDANATGYFTYFAGQLSPFGADAGNPQKGWYSYDVGSWHLIAINSECAAGLAAQVGWSGGCAAGSPQEQWLRQDLAADDSSCTLAYWHHPRFSSAAPTLNDNPVMGPIWQALYDDYADVVLTGHAHHYERFTPQDPGGEAAPGRGIREWVVGTGGRSMTTLDPPKPTTEARQNAAYGVLKLTLHGPSTAHPHGWYEWEFLNDSQSGETPTFTDTGSADCVDRPAPRSSPPPPKPTTAPTPAPAAAPKKQRIAARVTRVLDGDTIKARALGGKRRRYTVRLLGIDAPQRKPLECASRSAMRKLRRLGFVGRKGRRVTLITDPTQPTRDRRGRLLAYVKRRDGVNLALSQLRTGWARLLTSTPRFQLFDRFRATQRRARRARRGAWGRCGGDFHRRLRKRA